MIRFVTRDELTSQILERAYNDEIDIMTGFSTLEQCYGMIVEPPIGKDKLNRIQLKWIDAGIMGSKNVITDYELFEMLALEVINHV